MFDDDDASETNSLITVERPGRSPEIIYLESQAELILEARPLTQAAGPPAEENNLAKPLIKDLQDALDYDPDADMRDVLEKQARVLDTAFRRLLSNGDTTYKGSDRCDMSPAQYAVAMKAQDQFRRTLKTLRALDENEE